MTTVVAAIIEREGRVLICRRSEKGPHPLKWEFPGGKVEPGETLADALARELREELAVDAEIGRELTRYEYAYAGKTPILLVFFAAAFEGREENRVFERVEWARRGTLAEFDFLEGDVAFVKRLSAPGTERCDPDSASS
jgi:mutator protein MutT